MKPLTLHVRGPITPVNSGEVVSLTCIAEGARPAASVLWFNRSQVIHPQPLPSTDMLSDGSFRTSSTLTFSASRYDHEQELSCMGTNQVLKESGEPALVKPVALKVLCKLIPSFLLPSSLIFLSLPRKCSFNIQLRPSVRSMSGGRILLEKQS